MDHELRRRAIGERLGTLGVDAVLVTELVNVRYLTGFTGSNGQLLVTADGATFLTDGRYTEQARHEVPDRTHVTYRRTYRDDLPGLVRRRGASGVRGARRHRGRSREARPAPGRASSSSPSTDRSSAGVA